MKCAYTLWQTEACLLHRLDFFISRTDLLYLYIGIVNACHEARALLKSSGVHFWIDIENACHKMGVRFATATVHSAAVALSGGGEAARVVGVERNPAS
jgi:hypothetical protein